ncbi:MAG: 50S ribosomal protein L31 [Gammaproteobacteria bacterium RIFCSPHIGHO2_12_FULL_35_23]|nr:MAG: 50S ribosomal protein L31 [Gammaproteobacteria bacterium RIFCSPHIGHO2_12_FULL_35_23]
MRADIHPSYNEIKVTCSCGNAFTTGSTRTKDLHIEICSQCHPFYTGQQKIIDTAGRVDRFKQKYGKRKAKQDETKE